MDLKYIMYPNYLFSNTFFLHKLSSPNVYFTNTN